MDIAEHINTARETAGVSIKQLSETAQIPRTTLTRQLDGVSDFEFRQLVRTCAALGVSVVVGNVAYTEPHPYQ